MNDPKYPDVEVQLTGINGNAFVIIGEVSEALRKAGHEDVVREFRTEATSGDYDHLLATVMAYVEVS